MKCKLIFLAIFLNLVFACSSRKNLSDINDNHPIMRLHDIWSLIEISGYDELLKRENAPNIEIFIEKREILGFGGCNSYSGNISEVNENEISFENIISTKMACEQLELEEYFFQALNNTRNYQLDKLHLIFLDNKGNKSLVFVKVD